ncbi:hypothetical protein GJ744_007536 [Endocarpon pusillum]|uniref:Uncharacterized protein n=1 Tax=Endocarpon pusillum TaxID=364733 RepID=A0A8H7E5Y2_9EURO|nr:hypothetical protein GJ744_007536 [Endocarpon pusillum]
MHERLRMQHTDLLLRAIRNTLEDFSMEVLCEIAAAVLIRAVNDQDSEATTLRHHCNP